MFGIIAIGVGLLIAALLAYAASRPDTFRIERSADIQATAAQIYDSIADLHQWRNWSPFDALDPAMQKTYSGASSGKGAIYNWSGNSKAGSGRMEITSATPPSQVVIRLDFLKPFEAHNTAEFSIEPAGGSTEVTWALYGPQKFPFKVMSIFVSMDKMVGKDFERGLANLKGHAEKQLAATK